MSLNIIEDVISRFLFYFFFSFLFGNGWLIWHSGGVQRRFRSILLLCLGQYHVTQSLWLYFRKVISRSFVEKKNHGKGYFFKKMICFCLSVCFSQSSNRAELCNSLFTLQWKPLCLYLPLPSVHIAYVGCTMCGLHEFEEDSSLLMAIILQGLCSLNVLILLSYLFSIPACEISGLGLTTGH